MKKKRHQESESSAPSEERTAPRHRNFGSNAALLEKLGLSQGVGAVAPQREEESEPTQHVSMSPAFSLGAAPETCANGTKPVQLSPLSRRKTCAPTTREHKAILQEKANQPATTIRKNDRTPGQERAETEKQRKTWRVQNTENPNALSKHLSNLRSNPLSGPLSSLSGDARKQIVLGELGKLMMPSGKRATPQLAHKNIGQKLPKHKPSRKHSTRYKGGSPRRK